MRNEKINEAIELTSIKDVKPFVCYFLDDKQILKKFINEISDLVKTAYAKNNSYFGDSSPRALLKNTDRAKLVFGDDNQLLAIALYRTDLGGFKRFCSASRLHNKDKLKAANIIINDDIEPYDNWYWVEASGPIEKLFKENNGNPIPNYLAAEFLKVDPSKLTLLDDGVHYEREVGIAHAKTTKMIFGFKDKASAEKACLAIANYDDFKLSTNKLFESDNDVDVACQIVRQVFEFHDEWKCNEMLPQWRTQLIKAVDKIKTNIKNEDKTRQRMLNGVLARANTCLSEMPKLVVRRFSIKH